MSTHRARRYLFDDLVRRRYRLHAYRRWSCRFLGGFQTDIAYDIWQTRWESRYLTRLLRQIGVRGKPVVGTRRS
jgi:hypothetical protein